LNESEIRSPATQVGSLATIRKLPHFRSCGCLASVARQPTWSTFARQTLPLYYFGRSSSRSYLTDYDSVVLTRAYITYVRTYMQATALLSVVTTSTFLLVNSVWQVARSRRPPLRDETKRTNAGRNNPYTYALTHSVASGGGPVSSNTNYRKTGVRSPQMEGKDEHWRINNICPTAPPPFSGAYLHYSLER